MTELGTITFISVNGAGFVWKVAVEHGSTIFTEKLETAVRALTVAVKEKL